MLSQRSLEILLDLVEIKLSSILVQDKDDMKELQRLKKCRNEIVASIKKTIPNSDVFNNDGFSSQFGTLHNS